MRSPSNAVINKKNFRGLREKVFIPLLLALMTILSNNTFCLAVDGPVPKMTIDPMVYDAMVVKEGTVIEHAFPVRNNGDSPLTIEKVKPG